jgi:hypothetical protein
MGVQYKKDMSGHFNALINLDGQWLLYDRVNITGDRFISIEQP